MHLTHHAEHRSIKRNIPRHVIAATYEFGSARPCRGATSLTLDETAIDFASENDDQLRHKLGRYSGVYIIVGTNDRVLTVAWPMRRFRQ